MGGSNERNFPPDEPPLLALGAVRLPGCIVFCAGRVSKYHVIIHDDRKAKIDVVITAISDWNGLKKYPKYIK